MDAPRANSTGAKSSSGSAGAVRRPRTPAPAGKTAPVDNQRSTPVTTPGRTKPGRKTKHTSEEIHTRPRRPADTPPRKPSGKRMVGFSAPRPRGRISLLTIGRAIIALLTTMVLVVTGYAWSSVNGLTSSATLLSGLGLGGDADGAMDILLVGTDSRVDAKGNPLSDEELKWLRVGAEETTSTDTILLIRIPEDGSAATAISIPRDSYVQVPGIGMSKINAAYGTTREGVRAGAVENGTDEATAEKMGDEAGRKALISSVASLTGVTVDHYAEVGLLGFALLTDAVGGVEVCLKSRVNEPMSGARFRKGRQTLDGAQALSFVRQRHDLPRGDLDRITRQQVYMASLAQKVLSTGTLTNPSKLNELENAVSRSVAMDDGWNVLQLADQLKDLSGGNVKFSTIPVVDEQGWSDDGTQSVVVVDPDQVHKFVDVQLGKTDANSDPRSASVVDVVNAGTVDGLAGNVSGLLTAKGYREGKTSTKPMNEFDSVVFANADDTDAAKRLVKDLGGDIEIRTDSSLPKGQLRAVLTNTYSGMGALSATGDQGENSNDGSSETGVAKAKARPSIKADGKGPVCVN